MDNKIRLSTSSFSAWILGQNKSDKKGGNRTFLSDSYLPVGAGLGACAFVLKTSERPYQTILLLKVHKRRLLEVLPDALIQSAVRDDGFHV